MTAIKNITISDRVILFIVIFLKNYFNNNIFFDAVNLPAEIL